MRTAYSVQTQQSCEVQTRHFMRISQIPESMTLLHRKSTARAQQPRVATEIIKKLRLRNSRNAALPSSAGDSALFLIKSLKSLSLYWLLSYQTASLFPVLSVLDWAVQPPYF
ncbi:hypothetical protein BDZ91DRAFT_729433 [Kalaharituber pfeilii]|nr:hypothetical protein BDZ91DRAFT_729433 [Kalaharituber pfeilii]